MRKKFGKHTKYAKRKQDYYEPEEYGNGKFYEEDEEYYESEEYEDNEEYYESEEYEEDEEYYESEEYEDDEEYYESEEYEDDEEYYESEEYEDDEEYYESEEYYEYLAEDDGAEPEISMETMEMVPIDYLEDESTMEMVPIAYLEDESTMEMVPIAYLEDEESYEESSYGPKTGRKPKKKKNGKKKSGVAMLWRKMAKMSHMDRIVAATGAIVMTIAIVTCSVYASAKAVDAQVEAFAEISERLDSIGIAGESGLLAVADAEISKMEMADLFEEETESEEQSGEFSIGLNMTSVEKDLKIKFINSSTKKLLPNIGFEVEVKGPDGKTVTWNDDDKDGIIYKKDLTPGKYQVTILGNDALSGYQFDSSAQSVTVRDKIEYKKIDVADEIKTESQVNAAIEDTAKQEPEAAPALKDTVEWVESTKTPIGEKEGEGGYEEIKKDKITDPLTVARIGGFSLLSSVSGNQPTETESSQESTEPPSTTTPSEPSESSTSEESSSSSESGGTEQEDKSVASVKMSGDQVNVDIYGETSLSAKAYNKANKEVEASFTWKSSDTSVASVSNSGVIKANKEGTAVITATTGNFSATCTVTVKDTLSVQLKDTTVKVGESTKIDPSITTIAEVKKREWSISDTAIADIAQDGTIKGKKAGTVTVTLKVTTQSGKTATATCKVTVGASGFGVSLDKTTASVYSETNKLVLKANVTGTVNNDKYEWASDNTKLATVAAASDGKSATITGVAPGTLNITLKVTRGTESATTSCKVTVKVNPKKDTVTKLKDHDGNQLYIKKNGEFVEAVLADYYTADKFYIKAKNIEYKYTGWQTLDGKTYFFTKDGDKVTGEQVIQGARYTFNSEGVLQASSGVMGIDVSKWNANINWPAVRSSGVSYVIIRCGYRGSSTGAMIADPKFKANIQGATNAGLKVGIYFFSQAVNEVEAVEEASMTLALIKGYKISYPIFIDIEGSGGRGDRIDRNTRTAVAHAYCQTIRNAGYTAGVYANKNWFETKMNTASLTGYKLWLAQYAAKPTYTATKYDMWQYTSKGKINGINGDVDLNISYLGY